MKTRIEFRAIRVRKLRTGEGESLSVAKFGAKASADAAKSASYDLLEVLEDILTSKLGTEQILSHEDEDGNEDPAAGSKPSERSL